MSVRRFHFYFFAKTLPNPNRSSKFFYTTTLSSKFAIKLSVNILPSFTRVTTLSCKTVVLKNRKLHCRPVKCDSWQTATVFSERELKFMFAICHRPSVCLSVVCRLSSVTFVHPTQEIEIFSNVSMPCGTLAIRDLCIKILRRSSQGNPFVGG